MNVTTYFRLEKHHYCLVSAPLHKLAFQPTEWEMPTEEKKRKY